MADIYNQGNIIGGSIPIDDTDTSDEKTWSSEKIDNEISAVEADVSPLKETTVTCTSQVTGITALSAIRRGHIVQVEVGRLIPAGTYARDAVIWKISPRPLIDIHFPVECNGTKVLKIDATTGNIVANAAFTLSNDQYALGNCVYLTDGAT